MEKDIYYEKDDNNYNNINNYINIRNSFWNYKEKQEDIRIYAEAVTLKQNLEIEYGKEITVSDCLEKLNGTLIEDKNINTETLER